MSRVGLAYALHLLDEGKADGIVASHLDRLSLSLWDFAVLLARADAGRFNVVVLDLGLDLTTPHGEFTAHVLAAAAQLGAPDDGVRTREALAAARDRGQRLGRPRSTPDHVVARIQRERASGMTVQAIADGLNADGVPTARNGASWQRGTVAKLVAVAHA